MSFQGVVNSALVAAVVGALISSIMSWLVASYTAKQTVRQIRQVEREDRERDILHSTYRALLLGQNVVLWMTESVDGEARVSDQRVQIIRGYLEHFEIADVPLPSNPTDGTEVADFLNRIAGRLGVISQRVAAAVLVPWNGLVTLAQPDQGDESHFEHFVKTAGFPPRRGNESVRDHLNRLVDRAEELVDRSGG